MGIDACVVGPSFSISKGGSSTALSFGNEDVACVEVEVAAEVIASECSSNPCVKARGIVCVGKGAVTPSAGVGTCKQHGQMWM